MSPTYGNNFFLAFDYELPPVPKKIKKILYIHTCPMVQGELALKRIAEVFPESELHLLKNENTDFGESLSKRWKIFNFPSGRLQPDFLQSAEGRKIATANIDLIFFGVNDDIRLNSPGAMKAVGIAQRYNNVLELIYRLGLYDWTCILDREFCIYYPHQIEFGRSKQEINLVSFPRATLKLPRTLLSDREREKLFELALDGPGEGHVVNIGNYLGGSSILLAKGSKISGREKIYSYDLEEYSESMDFYRENQVEDWIHFSKMDSIEGAAQ
ncbi:MAG: hypothetical protein COV67_12020 [Nitrospinae bacterium CG11_big_fil_rev_8_21_14_0_20_56_8]|nr:MAG: hypothetical protein COV67_12020 [Nitrospinae bacterium CG11_big_fil_rev_8_21_14_0_20_56_8]